AEPNDAAVLGLISEGADTATKAALNATYTRDREVMFSLERFCPLDGTSLDDDGLEAALAAMPPNAILAGGGRTMRLSRKAVISKPVNLMFDGLTIISGHNDPTLELTPAASGSTITGAHFIGAGHTVSQGGARMIQLAGAPGDPITGVTLDRLSFESISWV